MPIYAYKCESCGHSKDVLQKMSDAPLSVCPQCGAASFKKQLTAAGFQLKGSGWYVTDFRGGPTSTPPAGQGADTASASSGSSSSEASSSSPAPAAAPSAAPSPSPAPASSATAPSKGSA